MKLLAFVYFFHFLRHGIIFPFIPLYAQSLGASPFYIGIVVSAFSLLSLFLALPSGIIMDRIRTKYTLFLGIIANVIYSLLLIYSRSIFLLILAQFIGGLGFLFIIVGAQIYVSGFRERWKREKGFGFITFSAALGQMTGPFIGGLIFSKSSFYMLFYVSLIMSLTGVVVLSLKDNIRKNQYTLSPKNIMGILKEVLNPYMMGVLIFCFVVLFAISLRGSFLPVLLKHRGISESDIGILLSLFSLAMSLIRVFIGRILGAFPRMMLLIFALSIIGCGTLVLPLVSSKLSFGIFISLVGLGFGISQPLSMVMVSDTVPLKYMGISFGIRFTTITLATVIGPFLFGWLSQRWSLETPFYVSGLFVFGGMFVILSLLKKFSLKRGLNS